MSTDSTDHSAPDNVEHSTENWIPGDVFEIAPQIHQTEIQKGPNTYTGHGWTREEADKNAGEKYREGDADD